MHTWGEDKDNEIAWMNRLKEYNVYFSYPYDLDWLMLNEFYEDYKTFVPKKVGQNYLRMMTLNITTKLEPQLLQY